VIAASQIGTTPLFAVLNVVEGKVIGHCVQRHQH
jgi:hypothetical protein